MADFKFPQTPLEIDGVQRPGGERFFDRGLLQPDGSKSAFQKQHIQPQDDMLKGDGTDFVNRIRTRLEFQI